MTSQLVPSDSASAAACRSVRHHRAVADQGHVGAPPDEATRVQRQSAGRVHPPRPSASTRLLGSRKITGSARGDRILDHPVRVVRGRGAHHPQPRSVGEVHLRALLVVLHRADVPAVRDPDHDRHADRALVPVGDLRELRGDLVERGEDEPVELDLAHRPEPAHREADRGADDAGFGQRRVEDALLAELGLQPLGHAEHSAELADVLAHEEHAVVLAHRAPQPRAERAAERHVLHGWCRRDRVAHEAPSSKDASYSASHARC